jgi:hypothetical protein
VSGAADQYRRASGSDIALAGREPNPVLEAVDKPGGGFVRVDQEQARDSLRSKCSTAIFITGPRQTGNIHGGNLWVACFLTVS